VQIFKSILHCLRTRRIKHPIISRMISRDKHALRLVIFHADRIQHTSQQARVFV